MARWYLPTAPPGLHGADSRWPGCASDGKDDDNDDSDEYQYQPLRNEEIRVLHIERATSFEAPLRCSIRHGPISWAGEFDPYITLSYCWGEVKEDGSHLNKQILCEGAPIPITTNLDAALRYIRKQLAKITDGIYATSVPNKNFGLWIDAICINQHDVLERSEQVTQMSRIYANSSRLVVWLGVPPGLNDRSEAIMSGIQANPAQDTLTHRDLLNSPWFSRRWVIEEYVLTPIHSRFYLWGQLFVPCYHVRAWLTRDHPGLCMHESFGNDPTSSLLYHLYRFDEARCSDPRDLVYSLLPISQSFGSPEVAGITIDYAQSVEECFIQTARSILEASEVKLERLGPLMAIAAAKRRQFSRLFPLSLQSVTLPSWVPDWRLPSKFSIAEHQFAIEGILRPFEDEGFPAGNPSATGKTQVQREQDGFPAGLVAVTDRRLTIVGRFLKPCFPPLHLDQDFDIDNLEFCWTCAFFRSYRWNNLEDMTKGILEGVNEEDNALFMIPRSPVMFVLYRCPNSSPEVFELSSCLSTADVDFEARKKFFESVETITLF